MAIPNVPRGEHSVLGDRKHVQNSDTTKKAARAILIQSGTG